jgi:hypothetical protein
MFRQKSREKEGFMTIRQKGFFCPTYLVDFLVSTLETFFFLVYAQRSVCKAWRETIPNMKGCKKRHLWQRSKKTQQPLWTSITCIETFPKSILRQ